MIVAIASGFVAGCLMLGALALLNGSTGFASCTAMTGFGWLIPLVAGLVIGGVATLLLDTSQVSDDSSSRALMASTCASCGSPITDEWRLCPHCGSLLECDMRVSIGPEATES